MMSDNASLLIGDSTTDESLIDKARSFLPQWQPIDKLSTLKTLCLKAVRQNFKNLASPLQNYDPILLEEVVADPSSLAFPINDSARNIGHEGFWKRETLNTFGESECKLVSNGIVSWKRLFCEKTLSRSLGGTKDSDNGLISMAFVMQDYIFSIEIQNAVTNPLLGDLSILPNLMSLHLQYGNKIDFHEPSKAITSSFNGMQSSDATSLALALKSMRSLCSLSLTNSQIDDDLVRLFVGELNRHDDSKSLHIRDTLIDLDLSHNKITTEGLRLITKCFLQEGFDDEESTILATLKLVGNSIRAEGARTLARLLKTNNSLVTLDVRMNRLEDEGGKLLVDGLWHNKNLKNLSLSSNSLSSLSITSLCKVLENSQSLVEVIDLSCNQFLEADYVRLASTVKESSRLLSLDLRENYDVNENDAKSKVVQDALNTINESLKIAV